MELKLTLYPTLSIYRFEKYEIKEINNTKYVIPVQKNNSIVFSNSNIINEMLVDFLNIGKYFQSMNGNYESCEEKVLNYVNKYGLFGFFKDLPVNDIFYLSDIVVLRSFPVALHQKKHFTREAYFKKFYPTLSDTKIDKLINKYTKFATSTNKYSRIKDKNYELTFNINYAEPVELIVEYAMKLYFILYSLSTEAYSTLLLPNCEIDHTILYPVYRDYKMTINTELQYLKQLLDLHFTTIISQKPLLLKTCKHCGNVFIAKNPKAEYDTPQCKNQANVYKSREKNK